MKEKFTEGPWKPKKNNAYIEIQNENRDQIGDVCASGHAFDGGKCLTGVETIANANLIAAAPEMYEILKESAKIFDFLDKETHPSIELDSMSYDIRKILAKARGEI